MKSLRMIGILLAAVGIIIYASVFIVHQTEQALLLQFGDPRRVVTTPGLQFKLPFIQNVIYMDKRILDLDSPPEEVIAVDQKRIVVDAFARYRIVDPLLFYQTLQNRNRGDSRMKALLNSNMRSVLGKQPLQAFVRDRRDQLMKRIRALMHEQTLEFGIEIVDVRIRRADLPEENSIAIFRRMQTERQQEAAEIRAIGQEDSREIRARADKEVTVVLASAYRDSEIVRSQGDGCRNRIFAYAFSRDAEFFAFYRSMKSYEKALQGDKTSLVLSPESPFFEFFLKLDSKPVRKSVQIRRPRVKQKVFQIKDSLRKQLCRELEASNVKEKKAKDRREKKLQSQPSSTNNQNKTR